jgi:hypothetical protein
MVEFVRTIEESEEWLGQEHFVAEEMDLEIGLREMQKCFPHVTRSEFIAGLEEAMCKKTGRPGWKIKLR